MTRVIHSLFYVIIPWKQGYNLFLLPWVIHVMGYLVEWRSYRCTVRHRTAEDRSREGGALVLWSLIRIWKVSWLQCMEGTHPLHTAIYCSNNMQRNWITKYVLGSFRGCFYQQKCSQVSTYLFRTSAFLNLGAYLKWTSLLLLFGPIFLFMGASFRISL